MNYEVDAMDTEIEIHVLKDGTQMITATVAGRPIALTAFEWQIFIDDMRRAIEQVQDRQKADATEWNYPPPARRKDEL